MITFYNKNGQHVAQTIMYSETYLSIVDIGKIEYAIVDEKELNYAFDLVSRKPIKTQYAFCGDEARTIAANWN